MTSPPVGGDGRPHPLAHDGARDLPPVARDPRAPPPVPLLPPVDHDFILVLRSLYRL